MSSTKQISQKINIDKTFLITVITISIISGIYGGYTQFKENSPLTPHAKKITHNNLGPIQSDIAHIRK